MSVSTNFNPKPNLNSTNNRPSKAFNNINERNSLSLSSHATLEEFKKSYEYKKQFDHLKDYLNVSVINPLIEKSVQIGEFIKIHRINQKSYENRYTKKELKYVNLDYSYQFQYSNHAHKFIISELYKSMYIFDSNSNILIIELESQNQTKKLINIDFFD